MTSQRGHRPLALVVAGMIPVLFAACRDRAHLPITETEGPNPVLPAPKKTLIPTANVAPAHGWDPGGHPSSPQGARR